MTPQVDGVHCLTNTVPVYGLRPGTRLTRGTYVAFQGACEKHPVLQKHVLRDDVTANDGGCVVLYVVPAVTLVNSGALVIFGQKVWKTICNVSNCEDIK